VFYGFTVRLVGAPFFLPGDQPCHTVIACTTRTC